MNSSVKTTLKPVHELPYLADLNALPRPFSQLPTAEPETLMIALLGPVQGRNSVPFHAKN